ncbi:MAG: hypothetical protein AABX51_08945 [Nanoarchaeota archaeon]
MSEGSNSGGSLEEIVNKGAHHVVKHFKGKRDGPFSDRVKMLEQFHSPNYHLPAVFTQHAEDVVMGRGEKIGAYNAAVTKLYSLAGKDLDVLDDMGKLEELAETYVDTFLQYVFGKEDWDSKMKTIQAEGLSKEDIRKLKGNLFLSYQKGDNLINPLDKNILKQMKGKTRVEIRGLLSNIAERTQTNYINHLGYEATEGLIKDTDLFDLAKYMKEKAKDKGFEHPDHPLTRDYRELVGDLSILTAGGDMAKRGYRPLSDKAHGSNGAHPTPAGAGHH